MGRTSHTRGGWGFFSRVCLLVYGEGGWDKGMGQVMVWGNGRGTWRNPSDSRGSG